MKVYLFYRPNSAADIQIETFFKILGDNAEAGINKINVETRDGDNLSRLYNIMSYPSVVVATNDGSLVKFWHGELPTTSEVGPYLDAP